MDIAQTEIEEVGEGDTKRDEDDLMVSNLTCVVVELELTSLETSLPLFTCLHSST